MSCNYSRFLTLACVLVVGCTTQRGPVATSFAPVDEVFELDPSFKPGRNILAGFDEPHTSDGWTSGDWVLLGVKVSNGLKSDVWFVRLSTLEAPPPPTSAAASAPASTTLSTAHKSSIGSVTPTPTAQPLQTSSAHAVQSASLSSQKFKVPFGLGVIKPGTVFSAPVGRVLLETYDSSGNLLRTSIQSVPQGLPCASLLDIWQNATSTSTTEQSSSEGVAGMLVTLQRLGMSRALFPIRDAVRKQKVIQKPTVLGVLLNGLRLKLEAEVNNTQLVKSPWSLDAALLPRRQALFPVSLAGQRMFDCRVVVGPPGPPYNLTGGVLLFEAVHPEKPANRLMVRVLAAKRLGDRARLALNTAN